MDNESGRMVRSCFYTHRAVDRAGFERNNSFVTKETKMKINRSLSAQQKWPKFLWKSGVVFFLQARRMVHTDYSIIKTLINRVMECKLFTELLFHSITIKIT